jgi:hypothetical protein
MTMITRTTAGIIQDSMTTITAGMVTAMTILTGVITTAMMMDTATGIMKISNKALMKPAGGQNRA